MEFLLQVIIYAIFAYAAYYIANIAKEKNEGLEVEPALYAIGAVLFGFLWVMLFLAIKYAMWNNKNK